MDTLTHALSGALVARATGAARPRPGELSPAVRTVAGFAAGAFPDLDFVLRLVDTLTYLNWHQGPTHSLVLLPVWAYLLARVLDRLVAARGHAGRRWQAYFVPVALGLGAHIAGDAITAYGPMLLWPFADARFALPLAFVFDPWISAIVALGLIAALFVARPGRIGVAALLALVAYAGVLMGVRQQALRAGAAYAVHHLAPGARVDTLPQPLSPLHQLIVVEAAGWYQVARVTLDPGPQQRLPTPANGLLARISAAYVPLADARWQALGRFGEGDGGADAALVQAAWWHPAFAPFRRFAQFPVLDRVEHDGARTCVWFHDLRFSFPALPPSFRFGLCREGDARPWQLARTRGAFWID